MNERVAKSEGKLALSDVVEATSETKTCSKQEVNHHRMKDCTRSGEEGEP